MIVVPDADQDSTAKGLLASSMGSAGQRCMAASVAVGVADVDPIIDQLVEEAKAFELGVDMGTIVSKASLDRIISYIDDAENMGARVLIDGRNSTPPAGYENGYWLGATILDDVDPDWPCAKEEIFGPVLTVFKASSLEEAIQISNNVKFGLSSSVYTNDLNRAFQYVNTVEAGMVHINAPTLGGEVHLPFGGLKSSGVGHREQGTEAVDFFSEVITVYIDHAASPRQQARFI